MSVELLTASPPHATVEDCLFEILANENLTALFQPIVDLRCGSIFGYEGLIRGPSDSPLHSPISLFKTAQSCGMAALLERLCRKVVLQRFLNLQLKGRIFLNVSPDILLQDAEDKQHLDGVNGAQLSHDQIIFELTENEPTCDYNKLRDAAQQYRDRGLQVAIDDLGQGFSSLRLWSELRPEFVKIDMHFIQGIHHDALKRQFVQSIQEIAEQSGSRVIAEGIETEDELRTVQSIGIRYGQGYFLSRPSLKPPERISLPVMLALRNRAQVAASGLMGYQTRKLTARKIVRDAVCVNEEVTGNQAYDLLAQNENLAVVPVLRNGQVVGLINRFKTIDRFARPFQRELFGKKSCRHLMDAHPLVVEAETSLQDLSNLIVSSDPQHLSNGFVITEGGEYLGIGTGHDLMREITALQLSAARYANPLTQLPGNVPIDETIESHLHAGISFAVGYVDLDNFKPFNDLYGYRKGDEAIQLTAGLLMSHCDEAVDFVGHIGGDDFILVFRSEDCQDRCARILDSFPKLMESLYLPEHRHAGGYIMQDRAGNAVRYPLVSLSIGLVRIPASVHCSHHAIAAAASEAKRQSKRTPGCSLFIERRGFATEQRAD